VGCFAYTPVPMRRVALLSMVLIGLAATGCGGSESYSLEPTRDCLESRGARIGGDLDFVASTATGGAFRASFGDNSVKVLFGETEGDAEQIERAYGNFAFENVKAGLADVLRRYKNTVTLWQEHPQDTDLALVTGCLK
jgi:hypothetical protein